MGKQEMGVQGMKRSVNNMNCKVKNSRNAFDSITNQIKTENIPLNPNKTVHIYTESSDDS
jgi:hypothetical protein